MKPFRPDSTRAALHRMVAEIDDAGNDFAV